MRKDIYHALQYAQDNTPPNSLDAPSQRLLDRMLRDAMRYGLGLPEDEQAKFQALTTRISNLCIEFLKNCDEEQGYLLFTLEELRGIPESVIAGYEAIDQDGATKYKVTHKTPDIYPLFRHATNSATRKTSFLSYENRTSMNVEVFREIVELRKQASAVMGYDNWADYITEVKMAKTGKTALDFLDDLLAKIKPIGEKERDRLLKLKKQDCEELGMPFENTFYAWDYQYLMRLYVERYFQLNEDLVKQYLPVEHVVQSVLDIYRQILSVEVMRIDHASTWHEDVTVFSVWDKPPEADGDMRSFLGYLYLDLFPRENKASHRLSNL